MEDFFASAGEFWPPGQEDYHWHVLPGTELARERLARPYADLIDQPGLVPVRPEYTHITVQHIGPVHDIAADELAEIVGRVRLGCSGAASFAVTAGRAEVWETSIVCPLRPGYLLGNLWHLVTSASRAVTGGTARCPAGRVSPAPCARLRHRASGPGTDARLACRLRGS